MRLLHFRLRPRAVLELAAFLALCLASPQKIAAESEFRIEVKGGQIDAVLKDGRLKLTCEEVALWVRNAAEAVVAYYGRFGVPHLEIEITPFAGRGVRGGRTFARRGGLILIGLGSETTAEELADDWMMTHEMVHLTFPNVSDEHHWIEEGIATYVEPIARIQAGQMEAKAMWADLVRDMPKGLPSDGDKGLDRTHTWGRTYWGGALFCLVADVRIRRETKDQKGLQDALRGILNAGGDMTHDWEVEEAFRTGDRATGTGVLMDLYHQMRDKPVSPDLKILWEQLGVESVNGAIRLRDDSEFARIREAIAGPQVLRKP